jgi:rubrerythrin
MTRFFVCGVCGNPVTGAPPDECPIRSSPRKKFAEVA